MFVDLAKFFLWLWKLLLNRSEEKSAHDVEAQIVLEHGVIRLKAQRLILWKLARPIRVTHRAQDRAGNSMLMILTAAVPGAAPLPPSVSLPRPMDVQDLFDMEMDLSIPHIDEFWEFPERPSKNDYILSWMKVVGTWAFIGYHMMNWHGSMVSVLTVHYDEPHIFTDSERDTMRIIGRELKLLFPWLDGGPTT